MENNLMNIEEFKLINQLYNDLITFGTSEKKRKKSELIMLLKSKVQAVESIAPILSEEIGREEIQKEQSARLNDRIVDKNTVKLRSDDQMEKESRLIVPAVTADQASLSEIDHRIVTSVDLLGKREKNDAVSIQEENHQKNVLESMVHLPEKNPVDEDKPMNSITNNYCVLEAINDMDEKILIRYFPFVIGKQEDSVDFIMDKRGISRIHAQILRDEKQRYFISDLNAKNGTFVNNRRIKPKKIKKLRDGDIITFYSYDFCFKIVNGL
ncbi:MAG: FHA domain-containing protein [Eubacterium sp.]